MPTAEQIEQLRQKFNALQLRKEREYANRNGSYWGVSYAGYPFRFLRFRQHIERAEETRLRFAEHARRTAFALLPKHSQEVRHAEAA